MNLYGLENTFYTEDVSLTTKKQYYYGEKLKVVDFSSVEDIISIFQIHLLLVIMNCAAIPRNFLKVIS